MIIVSFFILVSIPLIYLSSSLSDFMTEIPNVGAGMNVVEGDGALYFVNFTGDIMRMKNEKVEPFARGCQASYLYFADNTLYFLDCLTSEYKAVRMDGNVKTQYKFKDRVNFLFRSNHYLYAVIGRYNISKPETCSYILGK
jgi:hypothetical protein